MGLRQAEVWHKTQTGRQSLSTSWRRLVPFPIERGQGTRGNQEAKPFRPTSLHHSDIQSLSLIFLWCPPNQTRAPAVFRLISVARARLGLGIQFRHKSTLLINK